MKSKDSKNFKVDVLIAYNTIMPMIYKNWRMYSDMEIKCHFLKVITNHIMSKMETKYQKQRNYKSKRRNRTLNMKREISVLKHNVGTPQLEYF